MISYRRDIDGLRALAVLAVVIFHIDSSLVPGGFIGVDIFFVISGFLITGIVCKSSEAGTFSFLEFYRRRIKRIIPVLTVVILATLIAGQFILLPEDLKRLSSSAIASQLFLANIYFTYFLDTSYFADDAALEPLLHLWSLGVEEQFYLFWPLVLTIGLIKFKRKSFLLGVAVAAILSFVLGEILLTSEAMFSYYMLPTRAGELLGGGICFFLTRNERMSTLPRVTNEFLSWFGLALVLLSLMLLSEDSGFPGLNAVPVTLGTALLIFSGSRTPTLLSRTFSLSPVVAIGLISYSMYLWHWPLLAFMKYVFTELTFSQKLLSFILILALSVLSYLYVEKPFKADKRKFSIVFVRQLLIPTSAIIVICILIIGSAGYGLYQFDDDYKKEIIAQNDNIRPAYKYSFVCQDYHLTNDLLTTPDCIIGGVDEPKILLWGDSNAAYFIGVLGELAKQYGFSFRNAIHSSCPPMLHDSQRFVPNHLKQGCELSSKEVNKILGNYDTVLLAGAWNSYIKVNEELFVQEMQKSVSALVQNGKRVILLGRVPAFNSFDRKCKLKSLKVKSMDCAARMQVQRKWVQSVNSTIEGIAMSSGAQYFDVNDVLCKDNTCSGILDDQLVYHDPGHLSMEGSILIGKNLSGDENASRVFSVLRAEDHEIPTLPWERETDSWLAILDESQKIQVVSSQDILSSKNWTGIKPQISAQNGSLQFNDFNNESYEASAFVFNDEFNQLVNKSGGSAYVMFDVQIQQDQLDYPLFRFRVEKEKQVDFDFIVDGNNNELYRRGERGKVYSDIRRAGDMVEFNIAIPVRLLHGRLKLFILPAASDQNMKYSRANTGQVVLRKLEVFLVNRA